MTRLAASGFATALALFALGGSAVLTLRTQSEAAPVAAAAIERPLNRLAPGQCRIHYAALPAQSQPTATECEHAEWLAQRWGGQVLEQTLSGTIERTSFEGRNDFTGVPVGELPRPGYCRAWIENVAHDAQLEEGDCRSAQRVATALGGRVLSMPL